MMNDEPPHKYRSALGEVVDKIGYWGIRIIATSALAYTAIYIISGIGSVLSREQIQGNTMELVQDYGFQDYMSRRATLAGQLVESPHTKNLDEVVLYLNQMIPPLDE